MSFSNLIKDIAAGNFLNAEARVKDWWNGLSTGISKFINFMESGQGKILDSEADLIVADILTNKNILTLTSADFIKAAKDLLVNLAAKEIDLGKEAYQYAFATINLKVAEKV